MTYEKCTRCGWFNGASYHVCITPTEELSPAEKRKATRAERVYSNTLPPRSDAHREAISEGNRERWRTANRDRDTKIVDRYLEGDIGYRLLAKEFNISYSTIINVMKRAREAGLITPRPPGLNIVHGG